MTYDWEKATKTQEIINRLKNGEKQTSIARDLGITQAYVATVKKNARLAELEDMIKSGQAVILPCKVGDTFYTIRRMKVNEEKVYEITTNGRYFGIVDMKSEWYHQNEVYLTKEAAEAKLKELKGE